MEDLRLEKERVRFEIVKAEADLHTGYRNILHAFTFQNIASTVINELSSSSSVLHKAFSFGKSILASRKKKKQEKAKKAAGDPGL